MALSGSHEICGRGRIIVMQWVGGPDEGNGAWERMAALANAAIGAPQVNARVLRRICKHLAQNQRWREETQAILARAVARIPQDPKLRAYLAMVLAHRRDFTAARREIDAALRLAPGHKLARSLLFHILIQSDEPDAARAMMAEIADIEPMNGNLFYFRMADSPTESECETFLGVNEAALANNPALAEPRYRKAIILARLGRDDAARKVLDLERHTAIRDLGAPEGFGDADGFRAGLADEIRRNPFLLQDYQATRGGLQTLHPRQPGTVHMAALLKQISAAVEDYERRLTPEAGVLYDARPRPARMIAWAVVYGPKGYQEPHIHPTGWLSGVYYVTAPRRAGETVYRGPLVLGALPPDYGIDRPPWGTREIEPVPGRIVMFPSYVPHGTRPSNIEGDRICVAFDVAPVQGDRTDQT